MDMTTAASGPTYAQGLYTLYQPSELKERIDRLHLGIIERAIATKWNEDERRAERAIAEYRKLLMVTVLAGREQIIIPPSKDALCAWRTHVQYFNDYQEAMWNIGIDLDKTRKMPQPPRFKIIHYEDVENTRKAWRTILNEPFPQSIPWHIFLW